MSKIFTILSRFSALCLLMLISIVSAKAADVNYGEMELGKAYDLKSLSDVTGQYTATETGVLTVTSAGTEILAPFSDEACTQVISYSKLTSDTPTYHYYYNLAVTAGQTIYFKWGGLNTTTNTLTFSTETGIKYQGSSPAAGSTINCTSNSQMRFKFNQAVACTGVEVIVGSHTEELNFNTGANTVFFELKEPIYKLMSAGTLKEGESFTIRLTGVTVNGDAKDKLGDDGVVEETFICGKKPIALVSNTNFVNTHIFKSFWKKGDADGIVKLVFDGDIKVAEGNVKLNYGSTERNGGDVPNRYTENVPFTVDKNVLTIDLTGKERTPETMLGETTALETIQLVVTNVCDTDNNPAYTTSSGSRGSYSRTFPYGYVTINASSEFTPANGTSLKGYDNVELFVTDYKKFSFDGVKFTYTDANSETKVETVAKSACTETADADIDGAYTLTIPVPAAVKKEGNSNIIVTLTNLVAAASGEYRHLFIAKYDGFTVLDMTYQASSDAAPLSISGATLDSLISDAPIVISTNMDSDEKLNYVTYSVTDLNPEEGDDAMIVTPTHIEHYITKRNEETGETEKVTTDHFEGEVVGVDNTILYLGHTYQVVVTGYKQLGTNFNPFKDQVLGTDTLYFVGSQAPYENSDITLESITPADSIIKSADNFVVTLNYSGLVKIVEDKTGSVGGMMGSSTPFTSCTPINGTDDGYSNQWELKYDEATALTLDTRYMTFQFVAVDQDGRVVPGNYGRKQDATTLIQLCLSYNGDEITVTPESGETVDSLYQFYVTAPKVIALSNKYALGEAYVFGNRQKVKVVSAEPVYTDDGNNGDASKNDNVDDGTASKDDGIDDDFGMLSTKASADDAFDTRTTCTMVLTLEHAIKEDGEYTFHIPAEYFTSGEQFESSNCLGFDGTYRVVAPSEPVVAKFKTDPENGSTVERLRNIGITFTEYDEIAIGSGMIDVFKDGEKIARVDAELDWNILNKANITIAEQTEKGIYTLEIPEGYFVTPSGDSLPAITLEYGIGMETGINHATINKANAAKATYTLSGVRVNNANLRSGIYIVNGKKVVVK